MYVCPKCKTKLTELSCERCGVTYPSMQGIPCLLAPRPGEAGEQLRRIYDDIYRHHEDVWIDQGRSDKFQTYFAKLAGSLSTDRVLELGCGEGTLLAALAATHKYGIDPSIHALVRARNKSNADCAVARAEELPFSSASLDLVVAFLVHQDGLRRRQRFDQIRPVTRFDQALAGSAHPFRKGLLAFVMLQFFIELRRKHG